MADYTYSRNLNPSERTTTLILRGGDLRINLGEWADLTSEEIASISTRYLLTAGRSAVRAMSSQSPGLYDILSPVAVEELRAEIGPQATLQTLDGTAYALPRLAPRTVLVALLTADTAITLEDGDVFIGDTIEIDVTQDNTGDHLLTIDGLEVFVNPTAGTSTIIDITYDGNDWIIKQDPTLGGAVSPGELEAAVDAAVTTGLASNGTVIAATAAAIDDAVAERGLVETTDQRLEQPALDAAGLEIAEVDSQGRVFDGLWIDGFRHLPLIRSLKIETGSVNGTEYSTVHMEGVVEAEADASGRIFRMVYADGTVSGTAAPVAAVARTPEPAWSTELAQWDSRLAAYNANQQTLGKWAAAFAKARAGVSTAHITTFLDSRTYGAESTGVSKPKWLNSWPGRLRRQVDQLTTLKSGTGFVPLWDETFNTPSNDPRLTWGSGVTSAQAYGGARASMGPLRCAQAVIDNSAGNGWVEFAPHASNASLSRTDHQNITGFSIYFAARTGATGLATIKVDGSSVGTLSLAPAASGGTLTRRAGTATNIIALDVNGLTAGTHTLRIEGPAGELCDLIMVEGRSGVGVKVSNLARSSTKIEDLNAVDANNRYGLPWAVDLPDSDLMLLMPISNDRGDAKATFKAKLATSIDRQLAAGGDVLLIAPCKPSFADLGDANPTTTAATKWEDIVTSMYELADEKNVALLDLTWAWQSYAVASGVKGLFGDFIHENNAGSELVAWAVYNLITSV